jgi:hypothetical protein
MAANGTAFTVVIGLSHYANINDIQSVSAVKKSLISATIFGKGHRQNAVGRHSAPHDAVYHPGDKRFGLAGTGPRQHDNRTFLPGRLTLHGRETSKRILSRDA